MGWLPQNFLRPRGWLMIAAGALALLLAAILGRRDLLTVSVFLLVLPPLAGAGVRLFHPGFTVRRSFAPALVETGSTAAVTLDVHGTTPGGGQAVLHEDLPANIVRAPTFPYPAPVTPRSLRSRYTYTIRPTRRGQYVIGPLRARFSDPFDVAFQLRTLDDGDVLTVAPAAVVLPAASLTGGRGTDGSRATRQRANPSDDDVMTRDYRYGDPLRRVHWPATARTGRLMVRQEESVTTPEAVLLLDRRLGAFGAVPRTGLGGQVRHGVAGQLRSNANFEWAVVAAVSVATHVLERGFLLRVLDEHGRPAFLSSTSAPEPGLENYAGPGGVVAVAQSLAALELTAPAQGEHGYDENLVDRLLQSRRRGPIVAITGRLGPDDAAVLAEAADAAEGAFALVVCDDPAAAGPELAVLRRAGWQAVAVGADTALADAWMELDGASLVGEGLA
ncbi:DUF58 domain-containing protein [Specibacter cremeus]|uniref:DUF58 domain-containing protein n=1 Tax=Specibacter cremeus TaxID=1629051 RepID=UPI000F77079A|nr:DUF58 domain-containing protein [Specibacter cremeus]